MGAGKGIGKGIGITLGIVAVAGGVVGGMKINKQNKDIQAKSAEIVKYQEDYQNSNNQVILLQSNNKEYEKQLAQKDEIIASKDAEIALKNTELENKNTTITEQNQQLNQKDAEITEKNQQIATLEQNSSFDIDFGIYKPTTTDQFTFLEITEDKLYTWSSYDEFANKKTFDYELFKNFLGETIIYATDPTHYWGSLFFNLSEYTKTERNDAMAMGFLIASDQELENHYGVYENYTAEENKFKVIDFNQNGLKIGHSKFSLTDIENYGYSYCFYFQEYDMHFRPILLLFNEENNQVTEINLFEYKFTNLNNEVSYAMEYFSLDYSNQSHFGTYTNPNADENYRMVTLGNNSIAWGSNETDLSFDYDKLITHYIDTNNTIHIFIIDTNDCSYIHLDLSQYTFSAN